MMVMRLHRSGKDLLLAAADKDLLGREFREGKLRLQVHRSFYEGEEGGEELLANRLGMCSVANLVGEEAVSIAVRLGHIDPEAVIRVDGVPHAQMARM